MPTKLPAQCSLLPYNSPRCPPSSAVYSLSLKELSHSGAMTPRFHLISTYPSEDPHFPSRHTRISGPEISSPHHSAWLRVHQACLTWTKRCSLQLRHPPTVNPPLQGGDGPGPGRRLKHLPPRVTRELGCGPRRLCALFTRLHPLVRLRDPRSPWMRSACDTVRFERRRTLSAHSTPSVAVTPRCHSDPKPSGSGAALN